MESRNRNKDIWGDWIMELIKTVDLSQSADSIIFSSLPVYADYYGIVHGLSDRTDRPNITLALYFNGDETGNASRALSLENSTGNIRAFLNRDSTPNSIGYVSGNKDNLGTTKHSITEFYVIGAQRNHAKQVVSKSHWHENQNIASQSGTGMTGMLWNNNNAITSIKLKPILGNFYQNTSISLYGIPEE